MIVFCVLENRPRQYLGVACNNNDSNIKKGAKK